MSEINEKTRSTSNKVIKTSDGKINALKLVKVSVEITAWKANPTMSSRTVFQSYRFESFFSFYQIIWLTSDSPAGSQRTIWWSWNRDR